jgi:methylmalonyl-CoA mutase cobalamin-binding subunit
MEFNKIRVLMTKPGLDGHDRGVKIISRAFTDACMEVVYGGRRQTPEQIVKTAIQEDVDIIGRRGLSGSHLTLFKAVMELLRDEDGEETPPWPNTSKRETRASIISVSRLKTSVRSLIGWPRKRSS